MAHLFQHAPLLAHQSHLPGLHERATFAMGELRGARRAIAVRVPEEAVLQIDFAFNAFSLGAHLGGALELVLELSAGGAREAFRINQKTSWI